MKIVPTKFNLNRNITISSDLLNAKLHQEYLLDSSRTPLLDNGDTYIRMFVMPFSKRFVTGDVVEATVPELESIFGSLQNAKLYTRSAKTKASLFGVVKTEPVIDCSFEIEDPTESVRSGVDVNSERAYDSSCEDSDLSAHAVVQHNGVTIEFKPTVNGVVFNSLAEAKHAVDLALSLRL